MVHAYETIRQVKAYIYMYSNKNLFEYFTIMLIELRRGVVT